MQTQAHRAYLDRLPSEWDRVKIKELGGLYAGSTPRRSEPSYWEGDIPWLTPSQVTGRSDKWVRKTDEYITQEGYESTSVHVVPPGSLLVTTRATIGEVAIAGVPMTTNQGFKNFVLGPEDDSLFYYYLLRFIAEEMRRLSSGSTFDEISKSDFGEIIVPRPSSEEQRRIAEVLDTVDAAIQQTDAVIAKQQQVKTGLLQDLLTSGLDEQGRLRDPERHPEQFKDSPLGRIPSNWGVASLSELAVRLRNGTSTSQTTDETLYPVARIETISSGVIDHESVKYLRHDEPDFRMQLGDILYSHINSTDHIGKVGFYRGTKPLYHGMNLLLIRADDSTVRPQFLYEVLASGRGRAHARREARPAVNQESLTQKGVGSLPIQIPPLPEQERILGRIKSANERTEIEHGYASKLSRLKSGLMQDLLTGKVRIPEAEAVVQEVIA